MSEAALIHGLQTILDSHDALRIQMLQGDDGQPQLRITPRGSIAARQCLTRVPLTHGEPAARHKQQMAAARDAEARLDPGAGRNLQAIWFVSDAGQSHLLLLIHHIAIDGVSWRVLIPDLSAAIDRQEIAPPTAPFAVWARHLQNCAHTPAVLEELPAWEAILDRGGALLPHGALDPTLDIVATRASLTRELSAPATLALLSRATAAYHARINDVLLAALAMAVAAWRGPGPVLVELESHGREIADETIDLSRTVGWFTAMYPVALDAGPVDLAAAFAAQASVGVVLKRVKEQLRDVPGEGLGYGMLRYINADTSHRLSGRPQPQIRFNYLGRFAADAAAADDAALTSGDADAAPLDRLVEVNCVTVETAAGSVLRAEWTWAGRLLSQHQIGDLADAWCRALHALADHMRSPEAGGHTPSDFPLVALSQSDVDGLDAAYPGIVDVLPLAPLQQGLSFHSQYDPSSRDVRSCPGRDEPRRRR